MVLTDYASGVVSTFQKYEIDKKCPNWNQNYSHDF